MRSSCGSLSGINMIVSVLFLHVTSLVMSMAWIGHTGHVVVLPLTCMLARATSGCSRSPLCVSKYREDWIWRATISLTSQKLSLSQRVWFLLTLVSSWVSPPRYEQWPVLPPGNSEEMKSSPLSKGTDARLHPLFLPCSASRQLFCNILGFFLICRRSF